MSVVIHEVAHGAVAYSLGDPTAKLQNRLTLNPINHLDLFGSFILPLMMYLATQGGFVFGWAKPVPYNPYNLRDQRFGPALVAAAGPAANLAIAIIFSLLLNFLPLNLVVQGLMVTVIVTNIVLAVFNLFPIPPLDGSKILFSLLPSRFENFQRTFENYGLFLLVLFLLFGGSLLNSVVYFVIKFFIPINNWQALSDLLYNINTK